MNALIIDIETIGDNFDDYNQETKDALTHWVDREERDEDGREFALKNIKEGLGLSPLTGQIVAIGVLDYEKNLKVVYFQDPTKELQEFEEGNTKYKPMDEKKMLQSFWSGIVGYKEFVTFNGRSFDVPYLMIRSAKHGIRPSKNMLSNRYINNQIYDAKHIDLIDQLSFYGALPRRGNLHMWCRLFGIKSPKTEGVTGGDVNKLFMDGKTVDIAKYNARDLDATKQLYNYWLKYLKF